MAQEFLLSGEPLPLQPALKADPQIDVIELTSFHRKLLDYLRRLSSKVNNQAFIQSESNVASLVLTLTADFALSATFTGIDWDQEIRVDDGTFTHSGTDITVKQDGLYLLLVDLTVVQLEDTILDVKVHRTTDNMDLSYGYARSQYEYTMTLSVAFPLSAGDTIQIQCDDQGTNRDLEAEFTRLAMFRIAPGVPAGGSGGGGGSDPWVTPV